MLFSSRYAILTYVLHMTALLPYSLFFGAPSLRELCALEFCGLNRDLGKASRTPEAKAQMHIFIPSH